MSEEYRKLFLIEFKDLTDRFEKMIVKLEKGDRDALKEIYRILHTIKGSAGVMEYHPITDLAHQTEDIVKSIEDGKVEIDHKIFSDLYKTLDFFKKAFLSIERNEPIPTGKVIALRIEIEETQFTAARATVILNECQKLGITIRSSPDHDEISTGWTGSEIEVELQTDLSNEKIISTLSAIPEVISVSPYEPGIAMPEVRIGVDSLDNILALVSEFSRNIMNLKSILKLSGDPKLIDTTDELSMNLIRLRDELLSIRLIPLSTLFRQFPTWFRNEAITLDKKADLIIKGGEIEVDRSIFEYLREPIIHILRNALVHGIEPVEERKDKGPALVRLEAIKEGDDLILTVSDNGRGIDEKVVKKKAVKLGLISKDNLEGATSDQIMMFLTDPRFTTLDAATKLGGRGIGLDIVKRKIDEIGGRLRITSEKDVGSTFLLTIPLSLAIVRSMVTIVGGIRLAVPYSILKDTIKSRTDETQSLLGQKYLLKDKKLIPIIDLVDYLNLSRNGTPDNILITEIDDRKYAFLIDKIENPIDLLVRPLSKELGPYIGASIHPDGLPILHIDLRRIVKELSIC